MLPESWLLFKPNRLQDEQPLRHTMAPDADADPSQSRATHRSASHSINQIKSHESQSAHCMLSLNHNTVCK
jgi:hypothetical protein